MVSCEGVRLAVLYLRPGYGVALKPSQMMRLNWSASTRSSLLKSKPAVFFAQYCGVCASFTSPANFAACFAISGSGNLVLESNAEGFRIQVPGLLFQIEDLCHRPGRRRVQV